MSEKNPKEEGPYFSKETEDDYVESLPQNSDKWAEAYKKYLKITTT